MDWYAESAAGGGKRRLPPTTGVVVKLTPAEAAVAAAVARGLSNKEIARLLNKRVGTVKNQLSVIFRKLSVRGRVHLIVRLRG